MDSDLKTIKNGRKCITPADKSLCSGCKACSQACPVNAIEFYYDDEWFWYPRITGKCVGCGSCVRACPYSHAELEKVDSGTETYAAFSLSNQVLAASSSGGVFSHLAYHIISSGGVVYGHAFDSELRLRCVRTETYDGIDPMRGSKYLQSDMEGIYGKIKSDVLSGRKVFFTGTPCQVHAVKLCFGDGVPDNLYTADTVCHGVPSPKMFSEYLKILERRHGCSVREFLFRIKGGSWRKSWKSIRYSDGKEVVCSPGELSYMLLFLSKHLTRPSCSSCIYAGKKRIGDISLGDFWGIDKYSSKMFNNDRGCSLVIINNRKGREFFESISESVETERMTYRIASEHNGALLRPFASVGREKFMSDLGKAGLEYAMKRNIKKRISARVSGFRKRVF